MTEAAKNLSILARKLSPAERLAAYRRGEITAVSLEDVLAKYRVT